MVGADDALLIEKARACMDEPNHTSTIVEFVSHDLASLREFSNRAITRRSGDSLADGPPEGMTRNPADCVATRISASLERRARLPRPDTGGSFGLRIGRRREVGEGAPHAADLAA